MKGIKKVLLGLTMLPMVWTLGPSVTAAPLTNQSSGGLLSSAAENAQAYEDVAALVEKIRLAAGGALTPENAGSVLRAQLAGAGYSSDTVASALNQLGVGDDVLLALITTASDILVVSPDVLVNAMLTNIYRDQGHDAARTLITQLRDVVGSDIIDKALKSDTTLASPADLAKIQTAAGGESDAIVLQTSSGVYDG